MGFFDGLLNLFGIAATNATNSTNVTKTNEMNWKINQANLDYARQQWKNQVAYNWDMFNAENLYNLPSAQRKRIEAAGFNPVVLADKLGAGSASGAPAPSANQPNQIPMQAAQAIAPRFSFDNVAPMIAAISGLNKQKEETRGIRIDNDYKELTYKVNLAKSLSEIHNMDSRTKGQLLSNAFDAMSFNSRLALAHGNVDLLSRNVRAVELQNMAAEAKLPYISQYAQAEIDKLVSEKVLNYQRARDGKRMTDAQVKLLYEQALKTERERLNLPPLTAKQTERLAELMVTTAENTADMQSYRLGEASYEAGKRIKLRGSNILQGLDIAGDLILPWK